MIRNCTFSSGRDLVCHRVMQAELMEACISDVRGWMANHQLKLNDEKTEFLIIGSRQQLSKLNISSIHVGASEIKPVGSVRNLGAWFDSFMTMSTRTHVGKVCSTAFRDGLYSIRKSANIYPRNPSRP